MAQRAYWECVGDGAAHCYVRVTQSSSFASDCCYDRSCHCLLYTPIHHLHKPRPIAPSLTHSRRLLPARIPRNITAAHLSARLHNDTQCPAVATGGATHRA